MQYFWIHLSVKNLDDIIKKNCSDSTSEEAAIQFARILINKKEN